MSVAFQREHVLLGFQRGLGNCSMVALKKGQVMVPGLHAVPLGVRRQSIHQEWVNLSPRSLSVPLPELGAMTEGEWWIAHGRVLASRAFEVAGRPALHYTSVFGIVPTSIKVRLGQIEVDIAFGVCKT